MYLKIAEVKNKYCDLTTKSISLGPQGCKNDNKEFIFVPKAGIKATSFNSVNDEIHGDSKLSKNRV